MPAEPANHGLGYGNPSHFVTNTKDSKAQSCYYCRGRHSEQFAFRGGTDGIILDEGTNEHGRTRKGPRKTDAHLVEYQSRKKEHQQEDINEAT